MCCRFRFLAGSRVLRDSRRGCARPYKPWALRTLGCRFPGSVELSEPPAPGSRTAPVRGHTRVTTPLSYALLVSCPATLIGLPLGSLSQLTDSIGVATLGAPVT